MRYNLHFSLTENQRVTQGLTDAAPLSSLNFSLDKTEDVAHVVHGTLGIVPGYSFRHIHASFVLLHDLAALLGLPVEVLDLRSG